MEAAHGSYCDDFPPPQNPVQFSNWSGSHSVSAPSTRSFGGTSKPVSPSGGKNNGKYPPSLYAPGAGQGPAPTPGNNGGGGGAPQATPAVAEAGAPAAARAHPERGPARQAWQGSSGRAKSRPQAGAFGSAPTDEGVVFPL